MVARIAVKASLRLPLQYGAEPPRGSLLPFLYQTWTITRAYSSSLPRDDPEATPSESQVSIANPEASSSPLPDYIHSFPPSGDKTQRSSSSSPHSAQSAPRTSQQGHSARQSRHQNSRRHKQDKSSKAPRRVPSSIAQSGPYIPFEGKAAALAPREHLRGSTITNWEYEVFQSLFRKSSETAQTPAVELKEEQLEKKSGVDSRPPREFPDALRSFAKNVDQERRTKKKPALVDTFEQDSAASVKERQKFLTAKASLEKTLKQIDSAKTDVEVWQILQQNVLARLEKMKLDRLRPTNEITTPTSQAARPTLEAADASLNTPSLAAPDEQRQDDAPQTENIEETKNPDQDEPRLDKAEPGNASPEQTANPPPTPPPFPTINWELFVLERSLPGLLVHTMTLFQTSFPGSTLGLTLIPALKNIGPSAFTLGTSTRLFNLHMQELYRHYSDIDAIISTLEEMDREVYEFDDATLALLASIVHRSQLGRTGRLAPGENALWQTDHRTRVMQSLAQWRDTVDATLQGAALRRARDQGDRIAYESAESGEDGVVGSSEQQQAVATA